MIVYTVSRTENNRTAIWPPFSNPYSAGAMINSHISFREKNGAKVYRRTASIPAPVKPGSQVRIGGTNNQPTMIDAPECINCIVLTVEMTNENGGEAVFTITQSEVQ